MRIRSINNNWGSSSVSYNWEIVNPSWTFSWNNIQDFVNLFFPSIDPTVSISTSPNNSLREYWNHVNNPTITANITEGSNPSAPMSSITFKRWTTEIHTWTDTSFQDTFTVETNTTYRVNIVDTEWRTATATKTYSFVYPFFWWVANAWDITDWITEADLTNLPWVSKSVSTKRNKNVTSSPNSQRFVFLYPESYWNLTSIIDQNWFETISDYNLSTITINSMLDWTSQNYKFYELKNDTTQTDFLNQFKY